MIRLLTIIAVRKLKSKIIDEIGKLGAVLINSVYGKSYTDDSNFFASLGFTHDNEKIVIYSLVKEENVTKIYDLLNEKFEFKYKNTGIAFSSTIDKI